MLMLIQNVPSLLIITALISIHLMLMLIRAGLLPLSIYFHHFNTSHVNVNRSTSSVPNKGVRLISIHLMLMLILIRGCLNDLFKFISIHLMLMLIVFKTLSYTDKIQISIHLMLMLIAES